MTELDNHEISLRPETDEDKDFLLQVYISTREAELKLIGWSQTQIHAFLTQQLEAQTLSFRQLFPLASYQIIERQQTAIGRLYLDRGEDDYRLVDIALLPLYRNQKLGRYLIQSIQQEATEKIKTVSLHVDKFNPAYRLYTRLGFVVLEDQVTHLLMQWRPDIPANGKPKK